MTIIFRDNGRHKAKTESFVLEKKTTSEKQPNDSATKININVKCTHNSFSYFFFYV